MDTKIEKIKELLNGECEKITFHNVSANWYRMNVDMYYEGDKLVDIAQITYDYELYAMPNYMTLDNCDITSRASIPHIFGDGTPIQTAFEDYIMYIMGKETA